MTNNKSTVWLFPWGYTESFIIASVILLFGFFLNFLIEVKIEFFSWPINILTGAIYILILLFFALYFKSKEFIKWLSSTPAAISAISCYALLVLFMGFIPQNESVTDSFITKIGLTSIKTSFPFLFAQVYFLTSLGMVTLRRSFPFKTKNIAFLLNHFGLWLTLFAATLGTGDIQRVLISANKTNPVYSGTNQHGENIQDLGIAIQLKDFSIDEYPPKAFVIDGKSGNILSENTFTLEQGKTGSLLNWNIEVINFLAYAAYNDTSYYPVFDYGTVPAAYVKVSNKSLNIEKEAWISCGSFRFPGTYLYLADNMLLVMAEPEPKKYSSEIKVYTNHGKIIEQTVEVNKPASVNGWKIYQVDYDHEKGRWSEISVLELVKDPWINIVYIGISLLIAGAIYMFWIGNKKTEK